MKDSAEHQRRLNYEASERREVVCTKDLKVWKRGPAIIQALANERRGERITALVSELGPAVCRELADLIKEVAADAFDAGVDALERKQREGSRR